MELKVFEEKMEKTLSNLEGEYTAIRAGRANPRILDKIPKNDISIVSPLL